MPMWKRQKIQAVLRALILSAMLSSPIVAQIGVYFNYSPSLPLAEHWFEFVDQFPVHEFGIAVELPGPAKFNWRVEGNVVDFPKAGAIDSGIAYWGAVGLVAHYGLSEHLDISFGPQFMFGRVQAKGTVEMTDTDGHYYIDFDGDGSGVGIGMIGAIGISVGDRVRVGVQPSIVYFGISQDDVPIVGRDADDPTIPHDTSIYRYKGDWVALSLRLFAGFEF